MRIKVNDELIKQVQEITQTDYELQGLFLPIDSVESIINDLLYEIRHLEEKIKHLEQDVEDNYIHRPMSDYTGDRYDDRF